MRSFDDILKEREENRKREKEGKGPVSDFDRILANRALSKINDLYGSYSKGAERYVNDYNSRYFDEEGKPVDGYLSGHKDWSGKMSGRDLELGDTRQEIKSLLDEHGYFYDDKYVSEMSNALRDTRRAMRDIRSNINSQNEFYNQFPTEDDYKNYLAEQEAAAAKQKEYEEFLATDTDALKNEVQLYGDLLDMIDEHKRWASMDVDYTYDRTNVKGHMRDIESKLNYYGFALYDPYGNDLHPEQTIKQKRDAAQQKHDEVLLERGKHRVIGYLADAKKDPDYDKYVQEGANIKNPTYSEAHQEYGIGNWVIYDGSKEVKNPVTFSLENKKAFVAGGATNAKAATYNMDEIVMHMSQEQIDNYNYLIAKYGREDADIYLEQLRSKIKGENATEFYEKHLEDKALAEVMYMTVQGFDQFSTGMGTVFGDDTSDKRVVDPQLIGSKAREDLGDVDLLWYNFKEGKWDEQDIFGNSLGQVIGDFGSTAANMAPAIALGAASNAILPGSGGYVTNALMGLSSGGNAYKQALDMGYTNEQAKTYGVLVGSSEAMLGKVIGSIGNAGNSLTGKVISKAVNGIDNGLARFAIDFGGKMASEALEEGLQEVLTPLFENIAADAGNTWSDIDWEQAAYSALLGALSAGAFEGPGVVANNVAYHNAVLDAEGQRVINNGGVDSLVTLANEVAGVDGSRKLSSMAEKVNGKNGVNTEAVGKLSFAVDKNRVKQNKADIVKALEEKGVSGVKAKKYADILVDMNADYFAGKKGNFELGTDAQWKKVTGDPNAYAVLREVVTDMDSSVNARNNKHLALDGLQKNADGTMSLTEERFAEVVKESVLKDNYAKQADNVEATVSDDGKTKVISTNSEVTLKGIDHIEVEKTEDGKKEKVGYVKVEDADGNESVVKVSDVKFASRSEAVLYDTFVAMDIDPAHFDAYVKNFNEADFDGNLGEAAMQYALGFRNAYRYGWANLESELSGDVYASKLTDTVRKIAYTSGQDAATSKTEAKQKALDTAVEERKASDKGKARTQGKLHMEGVKTKKRTAMQNAGVGLAKRLTSLGVDVYLYESHKNAKGEWVDDRGKPADNGFYRADDGSIHIDLNAGENGQGIMAYTLSHELTHFMRDNAPAEFKVFADLLIKWYGEKGKSVNELIEQRMAAENLSWDAAYEEVIARSCESFLADSNIADRIIELQQTDKKAWEVIRDKVLEFLNWMKSLFKDVAVESEEGQFLREYKDEIDHLYDAFYNTLASASETFQWVGSIAEAKTNAETIATAGITVDADTGSAVMNSVRYAPKTQAEIDKVAKALSESMGVSIDKAKAWVKSETSLASVILDPSNAMFLDYEADDRYEAIKKNAEYPQGTVDFSNLCKKRREFTALLDKLQKEHPNRIITAEEMEKIRQILIEENVEVACGLCYVEERRQLLGEIAQGFIDGYKNGALKANIAKELDGNDTYVPTIYDLITYDGYRALTTEHPSIAEAFKKFNNARGMQAGRLIEGIAEYKRDILNWSQKKVDFVNSVGGLRVFSFSDFEATHLIDLVQVVQDCAAKGVMIQAYTKVPAFANAVKDTNMKVNRSLIAKGTGVRYENGRMVLDLDPVEGIDINDKDFFDSTDSENVGNVLVGMSNEQIRLAMKTPFVDYIIPFHTSLKGEIFGAKKIDHWDNYKNFQTDKEFHPEKVTYKKDGSIKSDGWVVAENQINVYVDVIQAAEAEGKPIKNKVDFVNKFLAVAKEKGLKPRFWQFLDVDANGEYTYTEGYHKFLVDFKLFDQQGNILPQKPVVPEFDDALNARILSEYVTGKKAPVSRDAVYDRLENEVINGGVKYSLRNSKSGMANDALLRYDDELTRIIEGRGDYIVDSFEKLTRIVDLAFDNPQVKATAYFGIVDDDALGKIKNSVPDLPAEYRQDGKLFKTGRTYSIAATLDSIRHLVDEKGLTRDDVIDYLDRLADTILEFDTVHFSYYADRQKSRQPGLRFKKAFTDGTMISFNIVSQGKRSLSVQTLYMEKADYKKRKSAETPLMQNAPAHTPEVRVGQTSESMVAHSDPDVKGKKFSRRDSEGRELSKGQQDYFKDSKVADSKGRLKVMYHGTNADFTVFDSSKLSDGLGFFFTEDKAEASDYGTPRAYYLNIKNPFDMFGDTPITDFLGGAPKYVDGNFNYAAAVKGLREAGYDGIYSFSHGTDWYIAFDSNQIKRTDNTNPTEDADIRYSKRQKAPTFYSYMGVVVDGVKQEKMGTASVINMLKGKGVKDEEIKWSGIETWLEGKKSVTKAELQEFIAGSQLEIGEQMSSNDIDLRYDTNSHSYTLYDKAGNVINTYTYNDFIGGYVSENDDEIYTHATDLEDALREEYGSMSSPRWSHYKLDGGENYREIVFTMPNSSYRNQMMKVHWGDDAEGVLVHARIQDFVDADGNTMLFVEELQSDYHNEGHAEGYQDDAKLKEIQSLEDKANKAFYALEDYSVELTGLAGEYEAVAKTQKGRELLRAKIRAEKALKQAQAEFDSKVPDAPFKDTYHEYVMKRLLRMAAEEGYDSIGWTPAQIQSERWSDEFAEGYRIEYDQDIPKFLRKYGKKWGAEVGRSFLPEADGEVWTMPITDSMKDSVLYDGQVMYQRRGTGMSNRSILANALESATQHESEARRLAEYKEKIDLINAEEQKLYETRERIKELSFATGPKDTVTIKNLQDTATRIANRINTFDKQLLNLEATAPLKALLAREKEMVRKREQQKSNEALAKYREKSAETIREVMNRNSESRKRNVESRKRTVVRNKIKRVVTDLNGMLNRGTKERNVKTDMQETVGSALKLANVLFNDEITNEDIVLMGSTMATEEEQKLLDQYVDLIKKRDSASVDEAMKHINKMSDLNRKLADLFKRERARLNQAMVSEAVDELAKAYASLKGSDKDYVNFAYNEEVHKRLLSLSKDLNGTVVKDMSLAQLEEVYDAYKMIRHLVRESNSLFRMGKTQDLAKTVTSVQEQILSFYKEREKDPRAFAKKMGDLFGNFAWNEMKPLTAFETLGADAYTELFWDAIKAEGEWAKWMEEANAFLDEQRKKYGYKSWKMEEAHDFTLPDGKVFSVTLQDMLSIYAYSKREQAYEHMTTGGFQFDKNNAYKDKSGKKRVHLGDLYVTDWTTIGKIIGALTEEQKHYADAVQKYLTDMGKRGNEVSETLYGIGIFNEAAYFPLMSAKDYRSSVEEALNNTQTQVSLKNTGMTKQTVPHASNPIILQGFDDVAIGHIDKMAKYCTHVLAIENLRRVFDSISADDNGGYVSTKAVIEKVFGENAKKYFDQYITDLNGGVFVDGAESPTMAMFSKFKGTAVGASLSVIVQQPMAVIRAMDEIAAKHFILGKVGKAEGMRLYDEIKKYAPVAIIKEMGGFDVGSSRTAREYLGVRTDKGLKRVVDEVNDKAMWGAGKADELGWGIIWKAVKREVKASNKYQYGSAEFYKACGERFTEVVVRTQVYDSVNSRSGYMRSKRELVKFATSFMGEPTTVINEAYLSMLKLSRANGKVAKKRAMRKLGRTMGVLVTSTLLTTVAKSLVYAMRDDDDDEAFLEKWTKHTGENLGVWGDLNPLTMLPFARDIISIFEGWDVERPDMTLIANAITSAKRLLDRDNEEQFTNWNEVLAFVGDTANLFGLPVKNIIRDAKGIINTYKAVTDDVKPTKMGSAFVRGLTGEEQSKTDALYDAIVNGDTGKVNAIKKGYKNDKAVETAIRKALRENDPRIKEAAKARYKGDVAEYKRIVLEIKAEGHFSQDTIVASVNNEISNLKPDKESTSSSPAVVTVADYYNAIVNGHDEAAESVKDDLVAEKVAEGYSSDEAEKSVASGFVTQVKNSYVDGVIDESRAVDLIETYGGDDVEAEKKIKEWDFKIETGYSWSQRDNAYRLGVISREELISYIVDINGKKRSAAVKEVNAIELDD